jgi:hypothetical protein
LARSGGITRKHDAPPTAEETERTERQPGAKGHPHEPGASRESPEKQLEAELEPEDRTQYEP